MNLLENFTETFAPIVMNYTTSVLKGKCASICVTIYRHNCYQGQESIAVTRCSVCKNNVH